MGRNNGRLRPGDRSPTALTEQDSLVNRISVVRHIAERLTDVVDLPDLAGAVASGFREGLGATATTFAVLDPDKTSFTTLVAEGVTDTSKERLSGRVPVEAWMPASTAVAEQRALFWSSIEDRDREYPEFVGYRSIAQSWAVLPLVVRGSSIGVLAIGWDTEHEFDEVEAEILHVLAHQCAVALDRTLLDQVRRSEREVLELLSEGTRVMVSALDPQAVIDALSNLAVPRLAPWCGIYVVEGHTLRRVAIQIAGDQELAAELRNQHALSVDNHHPLTKAFRTTESVVVPVPDSFVRSVYPPEQAERILKRQEPWMALAVPIKASGEVIGVMSLVSGAWGETPPDDVRFAAEGLAARAGVALVNARRFEEEQRTASLVMGAVLPEELPDIPGYEVAARYTPAGSKVAGDWYDVVRLASGRYLVGIGDAAGHGTQAASLMGKLRNCARGFAMVGYAPSEILDVLHMITSETGRDSFATAAYGILDPTEHRLLWAGAGHLPPLEFDRGEARYVDKVRNPPLGCPSPPTVEQVANVSAPGSGIVLVTDGLVETRSRSLDEGMELLQQLVASNASASAEELTDLITGELCNAPEDDCCIVVLRRL